MAVTLRLTLWGINGNSSNNAPALFAGEMQRWSVSRGIPIYAPKGTPKRGNYKIGKMEWVLESVFACTRQEIHTVLHELASNTKFQFEDWAVLNCALLDYQEFSAVDLSDCLIARAAQKAGATTLFSFENEKKLGALPIVTSLKNT